MVPTNVNFLSLDTRVFKMLFHERVSFSLFRFRMMLSRKNQESRSAPIFRTLALITVATLASGCGSSTSTTTADAKSNPTATGAAAKATLNVADATNVVAQFLDAIRRGGETGGANLLLTEHAQAVLKKIGRTVQPIGSPDAVFKVTRAEAVPSTPGAALVHSLWTEPVAEGKTESYQVVWALEQETSGWRISGLAMDLEPGQEPMVVDFENANQMASLLNNNEESTDSSPNGGDAVSQNPASVPAIQR